MLEELIMLKVSEENVRAFGEKFNITVEARASQKVSVNYSGRYGLEYHYEEPEFFEDDEVIFIFDAETNREVYRLNVDESALSGESSSDIIAKIVVHWAKTGKLGIDEVGEEQ